MRRLRMMIVATGLALLAGSQTALAQAEVEPLVPPGTMAADPSGDAALDDLTCFLVMSDLGTSAPDDVRGDVNLIVIYYVGKLVGRDPAFDFAGAADRYRAALAGFDHPRQLVRCLDEFGQVGQALQDAAPA